MRLLQERILKIIYNIKKNKVNRDVYSAHELLKNCQKAVCWNYRGSIIPIKFPIVLIFRILQANSMIHEG